MTKQRNSQSNSRADFMGSPQNRFIIITLLFVSLVLGSIGFSSIILAQWQDTTDAQELIAVANDPRAIAINDATQMAVVAHTEGQQVSIVDLSLGQVVTQVALNEPEPGAMVLAPLASKAYITHANGSVSVVDTANPQLIDEWSLTGTLEDILLLPDNETLLIAARQPRQLHWVNRSDGVVQQSVALTDRVDSLALDSSGTRILAGSRHDGVLILDAITGAQLGAIPVTGIVRHTAWWESGSRAVAVTNEALYLIDIETFSITSQATLNQRPYGLVIQPDTDMAYVGNRVEKSVDIIDLNALTVAEAFPLPHKPETVTFDITTSQVYATLFVEGTLVRQNIAEPIMSNSINLQQYLSDIAISESTHQAVIVAGEELAFTVDLDDRSFASINLPVGATKIAIDNLRQLAVIGSNDNTPSLYFIDLSSATVLPDSVTIPNGIHRVVVDSEHGLALVVAMDKKTLHLINLDSFAEVGVLNTTGKFKDVAIHSGRNKAYGIHRNTDTNEHTLRAIDLSVPAFGTQVIESLVSLAAKSKRLAINTQNDTAIVISQESNVLQVVDLQQNIISSEQVFDERPSAIAINLNTQLAVIASKSTDQLAYLQLVDEALTQNAKWINNPRRLAISEASNQALVLTGRPGEIVFVDLPETLPTLSFISPAEGATLDTLTPTLELAYNDPQDDIDTNSLTILLNGTPLTVSCTFVANPAESGGVASCVPSQDFVAGPVTLTANIEDFNGNISADATLSFTINPENQAPSFTSVPVTTATVGVNYSYLAQAADADNDTLSYGLSLSPAGMQINTSTGEINWLPTVEGDYSIIVTASDGEDEVEQSYTLTVEEDQTNLPPEFTSTPLTIATVDQEYNYFAVATDPDSDPLTYSLVTAPLGMQIDSVTGDIRWTPLETVNQSVTVSVSDGDLSVEQSYSVSVNFDPANLPPTLAHITNQTIAMGNQVTFQLVGADPEGEAITYSASPLPLMQGASFNAITGRFTFEPNESQVGDTVLTFHVSDGRFSSSQSVTFTVTGVDPAAPTNFTGRLLDGTSMDQGVVLPLRGATVSFLGTSVITLSDNDGYFTLTDIPLTEGELPVFAIDSSTADDAPGGASYASFREALHLIPHANNVEPRAFTLPRNDISSTTQVNPTTTTLVENAALGVSMEVPAFTALTETGGQFTGEISISEVPAELAPASMPEFVDPGLLITIQPSGLEFATPLAITFPNVDDLPPGSEVDLWSVDPSIGAFEIVGTGRVTADGQFIETISGGFPRASWGFPAPQPPKDPEPEGDPDYPDQDCEKTGSWTCLNDGKMTNKFSLPIYRSLESDRSWSFIYQTSRADPRPIISFTTSITTVIPNTISASLQVGGVNQGREVFFDTEGLTTNRDVRIGLSFDASTMPSGVYPARITAVNNFNASILRSFATNDVQVVNEQASPFGAGWMLSILSTLVVNADGTVLCVMPSGRHTIYRPDTVNGGFISPAGNFSTLVRNADNSFTLTDQYGNQSHYNTSGIKTAMQDRNGNSTTFTYDGSNRLQTITDPVGLETHFSYQLGRMKSVTDPAGRVTQFQHDERGNLTRVIYPDNSRVRYDYSGNLMTQRTDERENITEYQYDSFGRNNRVVLPDNTVRNIRNQNGIGLLAVDGLIGTAANPSPFFANDEASAIFVDARGNPKFKMLDDHSRSTLSIDEVGRVYEYVRNEDSLALESTRPNGSKVLRTFDTLGNVLTITEDFNNALSTYQYDNFSLVTSFTNPNNHATVYNRNASTGNVESRVNELGHTTTYTYDSRGLILTALEPNGRFIEYTYNGLGLVETITETPPASSAGNVRVTTYTYFDTGLVETLTTPDAITYTYSYDERSRPLGYIDNMGQRMVLSYDAYGNVERTDIINSDSSAALQTELDYDSRNRLVGSRKPHELGESVMQTLLDPNSNRIGMVDPNNNASQYSYDAANRMASFTHSLNGVTRYTYDTNNRITSVTAPNGVVTLYQYDLLGRRTIEISPDRGRITYDAYDLANNLLQQTDARGVITSYQYDGLERLTNKNFLNNQENVAYSYDSCSFGTGYLCQITDESGSYNYAYDAFGNVVQMDKVELGQSYTTQYSYDNGDNIIAMTLPSGRTINYQRDAVRRIAGITAEVNGSTASIASNMQYRADSQLTQCTFGNGLVDDRQYDLQGRLVLQSLGSIDNRNYSYDANSNMLSRTTTPQSSVYQYDALDRLTSDQIDTDSALAFSYDLNHNRLAQTQDTDLAENYRYTQSSNRLAVVERLEVGSNTVEPLSTETRSYNDANRWFELFEDGELKAQYIYNSLGQRTRKVIENTDGSQTTTIYHYNLQGQLISETTEAGQAIKDYLWHGMAPVAQIEAGVTESIYYLHTDHLMTPRLGTNNIGEVVWRWEGQAFGEADAQNDVDGNGELVEINLRFPGQYYDAETQMHYNYFRNYDPGTGRYGQSDRIGLSGGVNTYGYVLQNPIFYIDLFGEQSRPHRRSGPGNNPYTMGPMGWPRRTFPRNDHRFSDPHFRPRSGGPDPYRDIKETIDKIYGDLIDPNDLNKKEACLLFPDRCKKDDDDDDKNFCPIGS